MRDGAAGSAGGEILDLGKGGVPPSRIFQAPGKGRSKGKPIPGSAQPWLCPQAGSDCWVFTEPLPNTTFHRPKEKNPIFPKEYVDLEVVINP